MPDRYTRLLHPVFLASVVVLLVNDHVLKSAMPGGVTGKLSDFAGLIVLPVLLSVLFGLRRPVGVWAVHLVVGATFAALQFVPAESLLAITGLWVRHTPDPSDLVALAVLPVGVRLALVDPIHLGQITGQRLIAPAVLCIAVVAVVATSIPPRILVDRTPVIEAESASEAIALLGRRLRSMGVEAVRSDSLSPAEWASRMGVSPDDPAIASADSLQEVIGEEEGNVEYRLTVHHPFAPDFVVHADLRTSWDPATNQLWVMILEPRSGQRGLRGKAEESYDIREFLRVHVIRPLRDAGIRTEMSDR